MVTWLRRCCWRCLRTLVYVSVAFILGFLAQGLGWMPSLKMMAGSFLRVIAPSLLLAVLLMPPLAAARLVAEGRMTADAERNILLERSNPRHLYKLVLTADAHNLRAILEQENGTCHMRYGLFGLGGCRPHVSINGFYPAIGDKWDPKHHVFYLKRQHENYWINEMTFYTRGADGGGPFILSAFTTHSIKVRYALTDLTQLEIDRREAEERARIREIEEKRQRRAAQWAALTQGVKLVFDAIMNRIDLILAVAFLLGLLRVVQYLRWDNFHLSRARRKAENEIEFEKDEHLWKHLD
jgi:hypothetical protein